MEILDRLANESFTASEQSILEVILANPKILESMTAQELARLSYTSASTVVRLCKKLGCRSYADFRVRFLEAARSRQYDGVFLNANFPFRKKDSFQEIRQRLTRLETMAAEETLQLADEAAYSRAIELLAGASCICVYGGGINLHLAFDFANNMTRIGRTVQINLDNQYLRLTAANFHPGHVGIVISYSGENTDSVEYCRLLHEAGTPFISITCTGENSVSRFAKERLCIASMERQFSKLGPFSSCISIITILNYLYAGIFALDYDENCRRMIPTVINVTRFRAKAAPLKEDV